MARGGRNGGGDSSLIVISGDNGDNILGDKVLGIGAYFLSGGKGNDTYYVDGNDVVDEKNIGGIDLVRSWANYTLGDNLEKLTLEGTAISGTGNDLDNVLTGNGLNNTLFGLGGNDTLYGGDGADSLYGGEGDDVLVGDSSDVVGAGGGADLLDGGSGSDTAVFSHASTDYSFVWDGANLLITYGTEPTDTLRNIEYLSFLDGVIAVTDLNDGPGDLPPPQAVDDSGTGAEDNALVIAVLNNDQGQGLQIATVNNGSIGTVVVNDDGTVTYRPDANAYGTDQFSYTVVDSLGRTSTATVTVEVLSDNDAPIVIGESYSVEAGSTLNGSSVLANDSDADGDPLTVTAYDATTQLGGSVVMNVDGTFAYTPTAGFTGTDAFTYTVSDVNGASGVATVSVQVTDHTAPPYYVTGLIGESHERFNHPDPLGTGVVVTYTFLTEFPDYYNADQTTQDAFVAFSAQQQQATRDVLAMIESFTGITFVETAVDQAGMTFGLLEGIGVGFASLPFGDSVGMNAGDVWIDADFAGSVFNPLTRQFEVLMHEIGHAVGLEHADLPAAEDNQQYSLMDGTYHPTFPDFTSTYQLYDIAALQYLYGANTSFASGNNIYGFSAFDGLIKTVWDGGGHDVFDLSGASYGVDIDLAPGAFSTVAASGTNNIAIAFGVTIEDVIGSSHNDRLTGNEADNRLTGGGGADIFGFGANWGTDIITDFQRGIDELDFSGSGLNISDLKITSINGDTHITHSDNKITLVSVETIDATDLFIA